MSDESPLILGVPSKGRLMDQTRDVFAAKGLVFKKTGNERGYRGTIDGLDDVELTYLSASEISHYLKTGRIHMGVTGEDLMREHIRDFDRIISRSQPLDFGHADVVVAVPGSWIDVTTMNDIEDVAVTFHHVHDRRLRVATKYMSLTRQFFSDRGISSYRIVESLGATEGTPSAGTAEIIVDITSTGQTLKANHLKILDDGIILKSQANLFVSNMADWTDRATGGRDQVLERFAQDPE